MESNFEASLRFVLSDEGGIDDDPHDHGGRTSRGIIQREWNVWRATHPGLPSDVWQAPQSEIEAIYHANYWLPHCPTLPIGVDYVVFDLNVNGGPARGTKELQLTLGIPADGVWGPQTDAAVAQISDAAKVVRDYSDIKRRWYEALNQPRFLRGWLNRTANVESRALAMIQGAAKGGVA